MMIQYNRIQFGVAGALVGSIPTLVSRAQPPPVSPVIPANVIIPRVPWVCALSIILHKWLRPRDKADRGEAGKGRYCPAVPVVIMAMTKRSLKSIGYTIVVKPRGLLPVFFIAGYSISCTWVGNT